MKLNSFIGSDPSVTAALDTIRVNSPIQFLNAVDALNDPVELAEMLDIDVQTLNLLINRAELLSIYGVGVAYANMLAAVGIESSVQLQACNPFELHKRLKRVAKQFPGCHVPSRVKVEDWIEEAKKCTSRGLGQNHYFNEVRQNGSTLPAPLDGLS